MQGRLFKRKTILLGILVVSLCSALPVWGQSLFIVDRLTDNGEGSGLRGDLRYCLTNARSGADTITFEVTGAIHLTGALPDLSTSVTIAGPGADQLTVRRDTGGDYRIFTVVGEPTVVMAGLTIADGQAPRGPSGAQGGGLYVGGGVLVLTQSILSNNQAVGANGAPALLPGGNGEPGMGGGLYVAGGLVTFYQSTLSANRANGGSGGNGYSFIGGGVCGIGGPGGGGGAGAGGGLYVAGGTVSVYDTRLSNNQASGGGGGGGGACISAFIAGIRGGSGGGGGAGAGGGLYVALARRHFLTRVARSG